MNPESFIEIHFISNTTIEHQPGKFNKIKIDCHGLWRNNILDKQNFSLTPDTSDVIDQLSIPSKNIRYVYANGIHLEIGGDVTNLESNNCYISVRKNVDIVASNSGTTTAKLIRTVQTKSATIKNLSQCDSGKMKKPQIYFKGKNIQNLNCIGCDILIEGNVCLINMDNTNLYVGQTISVLTQNSGAVFASLVEVAESVSGSIVLDENNLTTRAYSKTGIVHFYTSKTPEKIQANQVIVPQANPIVDTQANPIVDTQANPIVDTQANPIIDTQVNPIIDTQVNPIIDTQTNPVVDPQANQVIVPQANQVIVPQANQVIVPQANQVVDPQANQVIVPLTNPVANTQTNPVANTQTNPVANTQTNPVVDPQENSVVDSQANQIHSSTSVAPFSIFNNQFYNQVPIMNQNEQVVPFPQFTSFHPLQSFQPYQPFIFKRDPNFYPPAEFEHEDKKKDEDKFQEITQAQYEQHEQDEQYDEEDGQLIDHDKNQDNPVYSQKFDVNQEFSSIRTKPVFPERSSKVSHFDRREHSRYFNHYDISPSVERSRDFSYHRRRRSPSPFSYYRDEDTQHSKRSSKSRRQHRN
jgi:hypothetical protein